MRLVVAAALAVAVHAMDTSDDPGEDITVVPNVSATRGSLSTASLPDLIAMGLVPMRVRASML